MAFYGRMCLSAAKRLNAGDRNSGILAWFVLMGAMIVPVAVLAALAGAIHAALLWAVNVLFLYATLRFLATTRSLAAIERTLAEHHPGAGANLLAEWLAEPVATDEPGAIARLTAEQALREAHQGTFALLFWFLVLPGPLGLAFYPLALPAAPSWAGVARPDV